jgi:hypothetical protein
LEYFPLDYEYEGGGFFLKRIDQFFARTAFSAADKKSNWGGLLGL